MVKKAPTSDNRNSIITVYDLAGVAHEMTQTNAREMVRHAGWTLSKEVAETRRVNPVDPVAATEPVKEVQKPAPVWEDLTSINKDILRAAAAVLKVPDIDGRSSVGRIVAAMDVALDERLTVSGDFDGAEPYSADGPVPEAAIARRRRAYALAAHNLAVGMTDETSLVSVVNAIAALAEKPTE